MRLFLTIITVLCIVSLSQGNSQINQVKIKYAKITTLQGNFTQSVCSENTGICQQFEGKFSISRPYYSRLEVLNPDKQVIVTDSKYVYIYLINQKKVYLQSADAGVNFFKIFDMFLDQPSQFKITDQDSLRTTYTCQKDSLGMSSVIDDLSLSVNNYTNLIEQVSFTDMTGAELHFELSNLKTNAKLSNKLFSLTVPKDVVLIKY